jgi:hypothetical protein
MHTLGSLWGVFKGYWRWVREDTEKPFQGLTGMVHQFGTDIPLQIQN